MKLHLRKNLPISALAFSISLGAHAATQADNYSTVDIAREANATSCNVSQVTGLPLGLNTPSDNKYSEAICALAAFRRTETDPVANCIRDLNQIKGKTNDFSKIDALVRQCKNEWEKLYNNLFNAYEEKYAECIVSKNPDALQKNPNWKNNLINRKRFVHDYEFTHWRNGKEIRGRDISDCLPSDADYTLLRRFISFGWGVENIPTNINDGVFDFFASEIKSEIMQAEKAEADRVAKVRAEEQARVEANERERYAINWRKNIKEGDYTNKGMVIEVRGNVIKVQQRLCNLFGRNCETDIQYVRRDELYP